MSIINNKNDSHPPIQQDPAKMPLEASEFPPGTFDNHLKVNAIVNMRCPVCNKTKQVTQRLQLNETRAGTGYIMPQNCLDCEKAARVNQGERQTQMLFITSVELRTKENPNKLPKFIGG